jgi:RNA polymerase sigma-70 factor, ECF subfamily
LGLWRSFSAFDGRCSLRTWVYRVAHNIATSHVIRQKRKNRAWVTLEAIEAMPDVQGHVYEQRMDLERLMALIHQLRPLDRQMTLLYLEGMDAASIGEVMGVSAGSVATKIHRIKNILVRRFHGGERDAE